MNERKPTFDEAADLIAASAGLTGFNRVNAKNAILLLCKIAARETRYAAVDLMNETGNEYVQAFTSDVQRLQFPVETRELPESFCFDLRKSINYSLADMRTLMPMHVSVVYTAGTPDEEIHEDAMSQIKEKHGLYIADYKKQHNDTPIKLHV